MMTILIMRNCKTAMKKVLEQLTYILPCNTCTSQYFQIGWYLVDNCNDRVEVDPVVNCDNNNESCNNASAVFDDSGFGGVSMLDSDGQCIHFYYHAI